VEVVDDDEVRPVRPAIRHRLTRAEVEQAAAAYRAGQTLRIIADGLGIGTDTLSKRLKAAGVQIRDRRLSPEQIDEAVALYQSGQSLATIGQRLGFSAAPIHDALRRRDVVMRGTHDWHRMVER
jgi:hypothetical protein